MDSPGFRFSGLGFRDSSGPSQNLQLKCYLCPRPQTLTKAAPPCDVDTCKEPKPWVLPVPPSPTVKANFRILYLDPPCTLNWGYMVLNSGYLGPNRGYEEGLGTLIYSIFNLNYRQCQVG